MSLRPLTSGEVRLARTMFGDSLDYGTIHISDGKCSVIQPPNTAMTLSNDVYMSTAYRDDYAQGSAEDRGLFIHELTHVWQYQNKVLNPVAEAVDLNLKHKFNYAAAYPFFLEEGRDLADYGMEQQASIVQEYYLLRHAGISARAGQCQNACGDGEKLRLYEQVLEKFLKDPGYARRDAFPSLFGRKKQNKDDPRP